MTRKPKLTAKESQIVKAKLEATLTGRTQRDIAKELYPNSTQAAAEVEVSKNLNKPNVQEAMAIALAEHNLTADRLAGTVSEAMDATKVTVSGNGEEAFAEVTPDFGVRLKAVSIAAQFMGVNKTNDGSPSVHFHQHIADKKESYDF
jgi:hypothetical protein